MARIQSRLLLLAGLLMLGWGIASWLEEGAAWRSLSRNAAESSADPRAIDVRVLIQEESRRPREPDVLANVGQGIAASPTGSTSEIELVSGTVEPTDAATPAWLTGEIEF
jgi:hypothetical protein